MTRDAAGAASGRRRPGGRGTGARALGEPNRKKGGLVRLLLALLALAAVALLALWLLGVFDGKDKASASASNNGTLATSKKSLLPVPATGLDAFTGQRVTGKAIRVVKVNGNQGFSVGTSGSDRVYVEWGGDVGSNEVSLFQPKTGQRVNLDGPVQAADMAEVRVLKLGAADAKLVASQRAFINADQVTAAK